MNFEKPIQRILIIKLRHLGDVLLSTPVFTQIKKSFPDARVDAYIWKEAIPILEGHPAIGKIHGHNRSWKKLPFFSRIAKEIELLKEIRKERYDLVINLTEGDRGAIACLISGAFVRVGVDPGKKQMRKIFTHLVKPCPNPRHTVEKDLDAVRRMGIYPPETERSLYFHIPKEVENCFSELKDFVLLHPGSRWRFKCLPAPLVASVIDQLQEKVVITGAPSELDYVEEILSYTKNDVCNLAGKTSLKELGALMKRAKGLITVDSVTLHMASALKTPVVALFGPTSEQNWGPWQHPRSKVVMKNLSCRPCRLDGCGGSKMSDCLWTLSADQIVQAFYEVASAEAPTISDSSLLVLNSLDMNRTE